MGKSIGRRTVAAIAFGAVFLLGFWLGKWKNGEDTLLTMQSDVSNDAAFIVIDSGHGFFDAGKTGINGVKEKEINLAIASKLRRNLEQQGYTVKMTRENDQILYDGSSPDTKQEDMKKRAALMNEPGCILAVSIHQNSFTEEKYKGAQVFYYTSSEAGHQLAASVQGAMIEFLDVGNTRQEKANSDYYLLKKASVPAIICECGFISNYEEAALLATDDYQEKTAWAITIGVLRYLNAAEKGKAAEKDNAREEEHGEEKDGDGEKDKEKWQPEAACKGKVYI